jgi:ADP-ribose pyrophosphatase
MQDLTEKKIGSQVIYDGALLHVRKDIVTLPNGKPATREYLVHQGAVCIVPLTEEGDVVMEEQYRYPVSRVVLEAPAGKRDPGEDWLKAAQRELEEETGIVAGNYVNLGIFLPSVAYTTEAIHLYLARDLTYREAHMDEDEFLNLKRIPLARLKDMVLDGSIEDGKTQAAILKTWHYLLTHS